MVFGPNCLVLRPKNYIFEEKGQKIYLKCLPVPEVLDCNGRGPGRVYKGKIGLAGDSKIEIFAHFLFNIHSFLPLSHINMTEKKH